MAAMLTPAQVAEQWNCSAGHVRKLCRTGQLRAMRLGSDWRISEQAMLDFEAGHTTVTDATPNVALRQTVSQPSLSVVPTDMDGALPEKWWENRQSNAASPAARPGGTGAKRKRLSARN